MVLECTLNLLFATALVRSFHARLLVIYANVRVTFIPVARGLFKLVGEVGISLDFVSELSRTKSITFPS